MNQDRVKELLLSVQDVSMDFSVVFTGKASKKVNGLYKPETREILIHNKNFKDDNMLMYTAVHEYAHHVHSCERGGRLQARAHTVEFWSILHGLLEKAEEKNVYKNVFADSPELAALTETIKTKYLYQNGSLVKDLGKLLLQANEICTAIGARFEDYVDRILRIPRLAARTSMKIYQYNVNPSMGADNMKIVAGIKNEETRTAAEGALLSGKSPDEVKIQIARKSPEQDPKTRLEKEKTRLEHTIESLTRRLEEIERELEEA
ncbi:hypothetical protein MASR2M78_23660 [Treponema sp.]